MDNIENTPTHSFMYMSFADQQDSVKNTQKTLLPFPDQNLVNSVNVSNQKHTTISQDIMCQSIGFLKPDILLYH